MADTEIVELGAEDVQSAPIPFLYADHAPLDPLTLHQIAWLWSSAQPPQKVGEMTDQVHTKYLILGQAIRRGELTALHPEQGVHPGLYVSRAALKDYFAKTGENPAFL